MDTVRAFLKVVKLENKSQFNRYEIRNLPMFETVRELKDFLLKNYEEEIRPATDCSFTLGFIGEGRTKCNIKTDKQLEDAYKSKKKGWITLWVDPHSTFKRKVKQKERRESRGQAKKKKTSGINEVCKSVCHKILTSTVIK